MTNRFTLVSTSLLAAVGLLAGGINGKASPSTTLKEAFQNDFLIGVAINQAQFSGEDTSGAAIIREQFDSISPENALKWSSIHTNLGPEGYNFGPADQYVAFGESNHMVIVGHTLVWHNQTPRWVFQDANGRPLSGSNAADRTFLLQRMRDHIHTVVGRY